MSQQLSRAEQGTAHAESDSDKCGSETVPTQAETNQESTPVMQRMRMDSPAQSSDDQLESTLQNEADPLFPVKENPRTKWFLEGPNCTKPRQNDPGGEAMVNGDVNSTCFKRPSVDSSDRSSDELNSNHLSLVEYPLKKRKSLSDSLLCTLPQDGGDIYSDIRNGTPLQNNVNKAKYIDTPKGKFSPGVERKQNFSKQNGSSFSHKKPASSNGPCCKHSDEDINCQRNRTTTHPCYDPMELPKRRRNAACTVAILSPDDRGSEDFLETKI